jgi:hypothetical protein
VLDQIGAQDSAADPRRCGAQRRVGGLR